MNHGYADVSYEETPEFNAAKAAVDRLKLVNLPTSLKESEIGSDRPGWSRTLADFERYSFVDLYPNNEKASIFGVLVLVRVYDGSLGSTYLKSIRTSTTILHYPSCHWCEKCHRWRICEDLGGWHQVSRSLGLGWYWCKWSAPWVRDEILKLFQYRMQEDLPAFFASFDFQDLEKHFAKGKNGNDEDLEARRVMERIPLFSRGDKTREGENRRWQKPLNW